MDHIEKMENLQALPVRLSNHKRPCVDEREEEGEVAAVEEGACSQSMISKHVSECFRNVFASCSLPKQLAATSVKQLQLTIGVFKSSIAGATPLRNIPAFSLKQFRFM